MSSFPFSRRHLLPLTLLLALPPAASFSAVLHWDYDGIFPPPPEDPLFGLIVDGSGTWDLASTTWSADNGATNVAWTNPAAGEAANDAIFGNMGDSASVTITEPVRVANLTFRPLALPESSYTIFGGTLSLNSAAPASVITTTQDARLTTALNGLGWVKEGTGTLFLSNPNGNQFQTSSNYPNGRPQAEFRINAGTVVLGGNNTKNTLGIGTIRITSGATLKLGNANNLVDDRTVIHIDAGGTFDLNDVSATPSGSTVSISEKFGYLEGTGTFLPKTGQWILHQGGGAEFHTFSGNIAGSGAVWVDSANIKSYSVQELTGTNTWTGKLSIYAGTLAFNSMAALGLSSDPVIDMGFPKSTDNPVHGILRYTGTDPLTFTRPLNLFANTCACTAGTVLGGGGFESAGDQAAVVTLQSPVTNTAGAKPFTLGGTNKGDNLFSTTLADFVVNDGVNPEVRHAASLIKSGTGTWHIAQDQQFSGGVEMNDGTLHLDTVGAFNATPGLENSLRLHGGTLQLNGISLTLGNGTASGWGLAGAGGTIKNASGSPVTLTIRQNTAQAQVFRGSLNDDGGGQITLVKQGTGSLTLAATAQHYAGATNIEAGTLRVEAPAAALPVTGASWHLDASDASTVTVTGGFVTEWRDKTSSRRHVTPPVLNAALPPSTPTYESAAQNGLNAVRFDGISDMLALNTVTGIAASASTIFAVCSNAQNGEGVFYGGGLIGGNGFNSTIKERGIRGPRGGQWYGTGENTDYSTPYGSEFRVNGALTATVTPQGNNYWHTLTATRPGALLFNSIGSCTTLNDSSSAKAEFWFKGDIGEIIVYPTVLTPEQRSKVEACLRRKWFGGTASANILPVTTPVTVAAGATFDTAAPQTIASLALSGALKTGSPVGELVCSGFTTISSAATLHWEVADWNGAPGTGYDVLTTNTLTLAAGAEAPVIVKIGQTATVANSGRTARDFTLIRSTGAVTGFDAAHFSLDASAFTAVPGAWTILKSGNNIVLHFEPAPAGPYDLWVESFGLTGAATAATADPDGDGWANILEFAVNGNPVNSSITAAVTERIVNVSGENAFTITLPVRAGAVFSGPDSLTATADGVTYVVEGSDALAGWNLDMDEVTPSLNAGLPVLPSGWEYAPSAPPALSRPTPLTSFT